MKFRDRFKIIDEIARGGMSVVYLAQQQPLGRYVAVKHLKRELTEDEELVKRFAREAEILASLRHRNIARIYEFFQERGDLYIVMEYVEGIPLSKLIHHLKHLELKEALIIGVQIARGLRYAHARGIIHRDLKPSNIIITEDGGVKILDFGVAHLDEATELLTAPGVALGTPSYMSPEQLRGERVSERSDVFAFGVVLYEMIAGGRPFETDETSTASEKILRGQLTPLSHYVRVPSAVEHLVHRCLSHHIARRPETFNEVLADIYCIIQQLYGYLPEEDVILSCLSRMHGPAAVMTPVFPRARSRISHHVWPATRWICSVLLFSLFMWGAHYRRIPVTIHGEFSRLKINGQVFDKVVSNVVYLTSGVYKLSFMRGGERIDIFCDTRGKEKMDVFIDRGSCM